MLQELLGFPADLDPSAKETLLTIVSPVFTDGDNDMLELQPTHDEIKPTILSSNLKAVTGSEREPCLVYEDCWNSLGESLADVNQGLFAGQSLIVSMWTALIIVCSTPKKLNQIKPCDKRRISILNCDFQIYEGLIAKEPEIDRQLRAKK